MRGALAVLLDLEEDIDVVAQVSAGDEVVPAAIASQADVALLDIELPRMTGLDAAAALREAVPSCDVLIVTTFGRPGYLRRALESGARGFLVKDGPVEGLAAAIRRVRAGETVVDPTLAAAALATGPNPLTPRERDVLTAAAGGASMAEVAGRCISPRARCATTCPPRSPRPAPATGWRQCWSLRGRAGSDGPSLPALMRHHGAHAHVVCGGRRRGSRTRDQPGARGAGVEHLVLERNDLGDTWQHQRWDSFRLNTPGWMNATLGPSSRLVLLPRRGRAAARRAGRRRCPSTRRHRSWHSTTTGRVRLHTPDEQIRATAVVLASGLQNVPRN